MCEASTTIGQVVALEEEETNNAVDECQSEEDDHFELQPTPRHAHTSPNRVRPRNGDADSNTLSEDKADCRRRTTPDMSKKNSKMRHPEIPTSRGQNEARNNGKMKIRHLATA
jgi:hypothetical protein